MKRTFLLALLILFPTGAVYAQTDGDQTEGGGQAFGDWVVRCDTVEVEDVKCRMSQMAIVPDTQERLMSIRISYNPKSDTAEMRLALPLGISLKTKPRLIIDGQLKKEIDLDICVADGCYSTFVLTYNQLEAMLRMTSGKLELNAGNGKPVQLPISGTGSRKAYNAAKEMAMQLAKRN